MKISRCPHCGKDTMKAEKGSGNSFSCTYCGNKVLLTSKKELISSYEVRYKAYAYNEPVRKTTVRKTNTAKNTGKNNKISYDKVARFVSLAHKAHLPLPTNCGGKKGKTIEELFDKYDLVGNSIVERSTGKVMFNFTEAAKRRYIWDDSVKEFY